MAEGVVSRAFIMANLASTPAATLRVASQTAITIQKFQVVTETEFISKIEQPQLPQAGPQLFQHTIVEPTNTVGESLARVAKKVRTFSEIKVITEALTKKATHLIAEPANTISDGLVKAKKAVRPISEIKSVGELLVRQSLKIRTVSEPANTIVESIAEVYEIPQNNIRAGKNDKRLCC